MNGTRVRPQNGPNLGAKRRRAAGPASICNDELAHFGAPPLAAPARVPFISSTPSEGLPQDTAVPQVPARNGGPPLLSGRCTNGRPPRSAGLPGPPLSPLGRTIADKPLLRLIGRWLRAGVLVSCKGGPTAWCAAPMT